MNGDLKEIIQPSATKVLMGKTILVVVHERYVRSMLSFILTSENHTIKEVDDAVVACAGLRDGMDADIIIAGEEGASMDGISFIKSVRNIPGHDKTPIIVLSRDSDLDKQNEWRQAGATGWLARPFTSEELLDVIEMVSF